MSNPWAKPVAELSYAEKRKQELDTAILCWEAAKYNLSQAKENELEWRKRAFELGFGASAEEGTNTLELGNGYALKGVKKFNYKLKAPVGFKGDTIDAVDEVIGKFAQISNEGAFIADRLFKWSVDMSITEYRQLCDEAPHSASKKQLLDALADVLEISEATPTLEIKAPKGKK